MTRSRYTDEDIPEEMRIDAKAEGSVMCRDCQRQIQRCICDGPNDAPLDTGPNDPKARTASR